MKMSQRFPGGSEAESHKVFSGFSQVLEQFVSNQLAINKVQELTRDRVTVDSDASTWVSSTRREGDMVRVRIGEQKLPENIAKQFGWGGRNS